MEQNNLSVDPESFFPSITRGMKILLIEDSADDETLTLEVFESFGILPNVTVVRDGIEALEYLTYMGPYKDRSPQNNPDLIIVDLKLPRASGFAVIKAVRSNPVTKFVPIVVFSSSLEDYDLVKGYECGANSYIRKPVDFKEFAKALKHMIVYWLHWNELVPINKEKK